jgi:cbb3-type cytochrome oxidase subunit 3
MSQSTIALAVAVVLAIVYLGLAVAAYQHLKSENRANEMDRLLAFTFWWPFYDVYEHRAKGLRATGVVVLIACVVANVAWVKLS